jgi:hypothetical protein
MQNFNLILSSATYNRMEAKTVTARTLSEALNLVAYSPETASNYPHDSVSSTPEGSKAPRRSLLIGTRAVGVIKPA